MEQKREQEQKVRLERQASAELLKQTAEQQKKEFQEKLALEVEFYFEFFLLYFFVKLLFQYVCLLNYDDLIIVLLFHFLFSFLFSFILHRIV